LGIQVGSIVQVWVHSKTDQGWIYAEQYDDERIAGWLPYSILVEANTESVPAPRRKRLRVLHDWSSNEFGANTLDVKQGCYMLVWEGSDTEHGWVYAEQEIDATNAGWVPLSIIEERPCQSAHTLATSTQKTCSFVENPLEDLLPPLELDIFHDVHGSMFSQTENSHLVTPLVGFTGFSCLFQRALDITETTSTIEACLPRAARACDDDASTTASSTRQVSTVSTPTKAWGLLHAEVHLPDGRPWEYPLDRADNLERTALLAKLLSMPRKDGNSAETADLSLQSVG
jgi:hypothetical protein